MERILIIDANARLSGKRLSTLDVIGVGPRLIASIFKYYGLEVHVEPYENIVLSSNLSNMLKSFDVVAISFMISDKIAVQSLLSLLHKKLKHSLILLGGPGTLDLEFLERITFSMAFLGEAEVTITTLLQRYRTLSRAYDALVQGDEKLIPGIAIKKGSTLIATGYGPWAPKDILNKFIPDVQSLKNYPFYWAARVYVEVVRGCSNFFRAMKTFDGRECIGCKICREASLDKRLSCPVGIPPGCGYCSVPSIHGPARSKDVDVVVKEVQALIRIGVTRIVLSAPDFLDYGRDWLVQPQPLTDPREPPPNIDAIERLLEKVTSFEEVKQGIVSISIENLKPNLVNEYVAEVLGRYLKGTVVYIGLESGSNELLKRVGRPSRVEECLSAIRILTRYGLRPYVYLMHGIPDEKPEDIKKSLDLIPELDKIGVERIVLYRFRPLPASAFEKAPKPPPAIQRELVRDLYLRIKQFNSMKKEEMVGKIVRVVFASRYRKPGYLVAYPLYHGPVVLVRTSARYIGCVADVKITKAISDRLVEGVLLYIRKRIVDAGNVYT